MVNNKTTESMYIRTMRPDLDFGSQKFEARVYVMGLVIDRYTAFSHSEASEWMAKRILIGGFDRVTIEVIQESIVGNS
jgi:hypothetical protein